MAVIRQIPTLDIPDEPLETCTARSGCRLCVHQVVKPHILDKYPGVNIYESATTSYELLTDIAMGKCSMSMTQGVHFRNLVKAMNDGTLESPYPTDPCTLEYSKRSIYEIAISTDLYFYLKNVELLHSQDRQRWLFRAIETQILPCI